MKTITAEHISLSCDTMCRCMHWYTINWTSCHHLSAYISFSAFWYTLPPSYLKLSHLLLREVIILLYSLSCSCFFTLGRVGFFFFFTVEEDDTANDVCVYVCGVCWKYQWMQGLKCLACFSSSPHFVTLNYYQCSFWPPQAGKKQKATLWVCSISSESHITLVDLIKHDNVSSNYLCSPTNKC